MHDLENIRRRSAVAAVALALVGMFGCEPSPTFELLEPASARGQDVLLITVDTLRADRLGCYGHAAASTPAIDRLAANGVLFEEATCSVPITLPSHASILTGRDAPRHGVRHNGTYRLSDGQTTLAERLAGQGYRTAAFVGAFVLDARYGLAQGFEHYDDDVAPTGTGAVTGRYNERPADAVVAAAIDWLEAVGDDERFFAWVHLFDPHAPYTPPSEFAEHEPYDGEIAFVDSQIAQLLDSLDRRGRLRRTLIVFTSDHGEGLGEHGEMTHADLIYDSTMRVPLIVASPTLFPEGRRVADRVAGGIDVVPTVLSLLGVDYDGGEVDGVGLLTADAGPDRAIYTESLAPLLDYGWSALHGLRRADDKFISAPRPEYYDLRSDRGELDNRYDGDPRAKELQHRLDELTDGWASDIEAAAAEGELSSEERRRLESLGYTRGRAGDERLGVKDPKSMMDLWRRIDLAGQLSAQGESQRALTEIGNVLREDPTAAKAWYTAATIFERVGSYDRAAQALDRALQLKPTAEGWANRARLALGRRDTETFERALDNAERLDPLSGAVHIGRAHGLILEGRFEDALREFRLALEVDPVRSGAEARAKIERLRAETGLD
ncbi:MAG: sulfatase-like hydrolase/transferase [bacterium]|nr:sulfatase-like hydrolase/transferase [bacterium]